MLLALKGDRRGTGPGFLREHRACLGLVFKIAPVLCCGRAGREGGPFPCGTGDLRECCCISSSILCIGSVAAEVPFAGRMAIAAFPLRASHLSSSLLQLAGLFEVLLSGCSLPSCAVEEVDSFLHALQGHSAFESVNRHFYSSVT